MPVVQRAITCNGMQQLWVRICFLAMARSEENVQSLVLGHTYSVVICVPEHVTNHTYSFVICVTELVKAQLL